MGDYVDADGYYDSIDAMVHKGSGTMTGRALRYVHDNMFKDSRTGVARIIVVITDGNAQDDVVEISEVMKKENIFISVVGVGKVDRNHIGDIASKIRQCREITCTAAATVLDLVFVVDSSSSIGEENFSLIRDFLIDSVSNFTIGINDVRVGLMHYSKVS